MKASHVTIRPKHIKRENTMSSIVNAMGDGKESDDLDKKRRRWNGRQREKVLDR